jgi:hypothetical protein
MDLLINVANVLYLMSYFMRDMLRLRLLTVVAATCLTAYFYTLPEPLMVAVYWNLGFIGLNLVRIVRFKGEGLNVRGEACLVPASGECNTKCSTN